MKKKWLLPLAFLVVMIIIMRIQGKALVTPVSPLGILDLEFARTAYRLSQLRLFWNAQDLFMNIYLDFAFIISYVWFLSVASMRIMERSGWVRSGKWAVTLTLAAGLFDLIENFLMMFIYQDKLRPELLQAVFGLAVLKFALIILVIFYIVASVPFVLFKKPGRYRSMKK
jgi:hypothetical protein